MADGGESGQLVWEAQRLRAFKVGLWWSGRRGRRCEHHLEFRKVPIDQPLDSESHDPPEPQEPQATSPQGADGLHRHSVGTGYSYIHVLGEAERDLRDGPLAKKLDSLSSYQVLLCEEADREESMPITEVFESSGHPCSVSTVARRPLAAL